MSHVRTQIRDRVAVDLAGVGTVLKSRAYSVAEDELPVLLVFTNNETMGIESFSETLERQLQVVVEIIAQETAGLDAAVDDLIADVEIALGADPTLNGLVMECLPLSIEIATSTEGAKPIARARLVYQAVYRTAVTDPSTVI